MRKVRLVRPMRRLSIHNQTPEQGCRYWAPFFTNKQFREAQARARQYLPPRLPNGWHFQVEHPDQYL